MAPAEDALEDDVPTGLPNEQPEDSDGVQLPKRKLGRLRPFVLVAGAPGARPSEHEFLTDEPPPAKKGRPEASDEQVRALANSGLATCAVCFSICRICRMRAVFW